MPFIDCKCRGVNLSCQFCFGKGIYDPDENAKYEENQRKLNSYIKLNNKIEHKILSISETLKTFNKDQLNHTINELIEKVDNYSKEQEKIVKSLSFRKDGKNFFKSKIPDLLQIDLIKKELLIVYKLATKLIDEENIKSLFFNHPYSILSINFKDTKELKQLKRRKKSNTF